VAFSIKRGGSPAPSSALDGTMTLVEHLRELRSRLFKAVLAVVACSIVAAFFYNDILALITEPFKKVVTDLAESEGLEAELTINSVGGPLTLALKVSLVTGIVLSSPIWLYQLWAFILPGLHAKEQRWTRLFVAIAGPLFMTGVAVGYYVLPKGLSVLLDFTPADVANLVELGGYLNFILRMLLVFGVAFEIPVFVLLLNLAGVVKGRQLGEVRPWIVVGTFVFAAVATPSTDPISMLFLAIPMTLLFFISEVIARLLDRRRGTVDADYDAFDDDETSDLELDDDADDYRPEDYRPSQLSEDDD
jgi:sec-independent protein translocase protein TatC